MQLSKAQQIEKIMLLRQKKILEARRSFWCFCKALAPDFYREERTYLKELANTLQDIYEGKIEKKGLTISMPPRHGKSRTVGLFTAWCIGKNKASQIMTCSYNELIGTEFSRNCRELIQEERTDDFSIVYTDIFDDVEIKKGNSSVNNWTIKGGYSTYYGGGFGSSFTGRGCNILIVDDPVKNADEALSESNLDKIYSTYTDTLMSRVEGNGITIIIQTRWAKKDLIGRVLEDTADDFEEINMKAFDGKNMLCEDVLSKAKYESLKKSMSDLIFMANYNQVCIDAKGVLYTNLKLYDEIPRDDNGDMVFEQIVAFIDTADKGQDYLACVVAGCYQKELYILDILYTQEHMEITEKLVAKMLYENDVNVAIFEANNGGGLFSRRINEILLNEYDTNKVVIKDKTQTKNKWTRIMTTSVWLMEHVLFPANAKHRWREAWEHLITFSKNGKNKHDDLEDCLTALCENFGQGVKKEKRLRVGNIRGI
ncbi:phage terminase large subunit [Clostridium chrysemydis]|uniref:phage terminase large subunit n=1 Tax=Clostridium chrysemydis TaxID=2665504 RepID=UPI001883A6FF|nr:phage terminase large subunit [Clostridium chrysemydis]